MPVRFFDSNVVLYSASSDVRKLERSTQLLEEGGYTSVQVLNEVALVTQRKMQYDWRRTLSFLHTIRGLVVVADLLLIDHETAMAVAQRYRLAIYDAMIVATALRLNCEILLSEDMHDGLLIDGRLRISNPFDAA